MSLCTVVELALQFESFRNVDLFHQGLYHLKTRIYRDDEGRSLACPYSYLKGPSMAMEPPKGKPRVDHHNLIPAHLNEEMYTFSTRSFLIRYCEEEVELGDVGQFRIELSPSELERRNPLLLEVELMFADLTQHPSEPLGDQPDVESAEFRCVSTQILRLRGVERGLHDFCPVVFDECHFCLLNLAVHSAVVDLRFRVRPALRKAAATKPKVAGPAPRGAKESEAQDLRGTGSQTSSCPSRSFSRPYAAMARSSASLLIALAAGALLAKNMGLDFVGMRPSVRSSSVAMRAEEGEEVEEKVIAEGDRLRLKVQSAEGDAIREAASEVILPSASGQLGILANHAPMMSALDVGVLRYKQDGKWTPVVVMGGFASVDSNQLSVLCNDFEAHGRRSTLCMRPQWLGFRV
ncbi:atpE [Symbiodinium natans]|uniref:AtpE protein n=1 Tax=Symbiodinium natans TaxID=878477 RepID=A0A812UKF7_9DINO|nr:atpE [Symbiodinium natans]